MNYALGACLWCLPYSQPLDCGISITTSQSHGHQAKRLVAHDPAYFRTGLPMDIFWCFFTKDFWLRGARRDELITDWKESDMGLPYTDPMVPFPTRHDAYQSWAKPPHLLCWLLPRPCPTSDVPLQNMSPYAATRTFCSTLSVSSKTRDRTSA